MDPPSGRPAYRIQTPRLVLRCYDPAEAPLVVEAIAGSLEHLRAWMPWAMHEPESVDEKAQRLRASRASFDTDRDYGYGIFSGDETRVVGGTGFHPRPDGGGGEIGYWLRAELEGQGLMTEAAGALVRVCFEVMRVPWLEIRCDPRNERSYAVARRLGFTLDAILRHRDVRPDGAPRDTMVWSLLADAYPASPAARTEVRAWDALRRRLL
jgi:RimJ/RimL family protein N-acetyltransferase